ncbi:rho guanine nucleotide exchange factor 7 isoform X6 [Toxorhynchites rutilus septentrionalis]|uniref:rho guanine nucleotide exchange factor 7 isoform X6 n=1 Tax=Toxorhynchites rutilus septentrionalis TaxID=329112 RepID=UPI0024784CDB|nr:rho guanine nucleotide exchange factor 7 isoform X6 [Toxorhynchites rutilus septentrionalis]
MVKTSLHHIAPPAVMDPTQAQITVQAQYSFKGSNNDELCFKKGDIITLTQREDGGWWEGTLDEKTGWFPSNYVKEYAGPLPLSETIRPPEEIQAFRSVVFRDLLESEKAHVAEIRGMVENFLEPLESSQILTTDEYIQLMCNFVEVVEMHEEFLQSLEESNDRVGKVFLTKSPTMKKVHQCYCAAHPRAIVVVDKYRDELNAFMEKQGAAKPGLLVLTTGLSKPFRRIDKYSAILQELERHMESCHPDRGDTQRSIAVYKDMASSCSATRRQKELELQILTGPIRGWQGQELTTLGDIIHMGSVAVGPEHKDRYFVLFPQTLLILSVSQRMSAFKYEGKLPLTGISVNRLEDTDQIKNAFEITGSLIDRIVAVCQGPTEANKWVDFLNAKVNSVMDGQHGKDMKRIVSSSAVNIPQPPPHMSPPALGSSHPSRGSSITQHMSQHKRSQSFNHHLSYNQVQQQQHQSQKQQANQLLSNLAIRTSEQSQQPVPNLKGIKEKAHWKITNLRPAPPLRPALLNGGGGGGGGGGLVGGGGGIGSVTGLAVSGSVHHSLSLSQQSTKAPPTYEEDALVLRVIEAYCAAYQSSTRNTMHSALQPWTPCLPIRGGKLKTSKHFSSSNPQLPFTCSSLSSYLVNPAAGIKYSHSHSHNTASTNSINTSHIWREASPNNFNLYSASICSLSSSPKCRARYSVGGYGSTEWRSHSEEKTVTSSATGSTLKPLANPIARSGSNYDNIFMNNNTNTPLLSRVSKQQTVWMNANQISRHRSTSREIEPSPKKDNPPPPPAPEGGMSAQQQLYDRRLNRSFETAQGLSRNSKISQLRRSTPQLNGEEDDSLRDDLSRNSMSCCNKLLMFYWQNR